MFFDRYPNENCADFSHTVSFLSGSFHEYRQYLFASSTTAYSQSMQLVSNHCPQLPQPLIWSDQDDEHDINFWPLLSIREFTNGRAGTFFQVGPKESNIY